MTEASTSTASTKPVGMHHVAYACRDVEATHHFYEDLMGFPLVHTEFEPREGGAYLRHVFYDLGDGTCIAFFDLNGMGEREGWTSAISTGNGLPVWVNHVAFKADQVRQDEVRARMAGEGIEPLMDIDHGWCHSLYFVDPNGIMVELCRDTPGIEADPAEATRLLRATAGAPATA
ncbi:MAG: VOC family protein [Ilumatobacteraceae bacterium]